MQLLTQYSAQEILQPVLQSNERATTGMQAALVAN